MKKSDIPKPKYAIGEQVIFTIPSEGNYMPRRDIGKIETIDINITQSGSQIRYGFENKDDTYDETVITRRALQN